MASRQPFPQKQRQRMSVIFLAISISASLIILFALVYFLYSLWYSLVHKSRTSPFDAASPLNKLQKFSYKELKSATDNFSVSNSIGKGGSGTVFRGILRDGKLVAVKLLDPNLLQREQEFQNELKILGGLKSCPLIVTLLGFCVEKGNRLLVFEYMSNRSLQESLFMDGSNSYSDVGVCGDFGLGYLNWGVRFSVILDVAKALAFLHLECEPPVIHGDVKPSNVLLDSDYRAKLSDFGLSRLKLEGEVGVDLFSQELSGNLNAMGGLGVVENENETPPIGTPLEDQENDEVDFALALQASNSSKNSSKIHHSAMGLVKNFKFSSECGDSNLKGKEFVPYYDEELNSADHSKEFSLNAGDNISSKQWGKDWWWRQDGSGELSSKDYVKEWIGSQICPDPDIPDWEEEKGEANTNREKAGGSKKGTKMEKHKEKKENFRQESRFGCLNIGLEKENPNRCKKACSDNHRKMHEWWKEENLDDMCKKSKKTRRVNVRPHFGLGKCFSFRRMRQQNKNDEDGRNPEFSFRLGRKKKEKNNSLSVGSDMWSGDVFSRELSSTTSMRGTLCYVAPEYNGYGYLMEKADIYSLGVLILVVVSGRRPLHVLASPMRLEKANLISWARSLAYSGNILELVDERLKDDYNKEQAGLCINLALACLQKMPELRPDIGDVVRVLKGEMEIPQLPFEFTPSPPSRGFSRSTRKRNGGLI
ncbi:Putative receptor-like protein kinase [Striga hermonthica]|uniref:non-specific serine/threonine protein kinase n=1 Tax=Striga hermonthica TaxID=68872 RepID=A0A9N7N780_STRHE|nr:Putative receptor-like protein kinase [Striga hermonthica]